MRKRKWLLLLVAFFLVATGMVTLVFLPRDREPRYRGRSLSGYLHDYGQAGTLQVPWQARGSIETAVRAIGTNAIPSLLEWIRYDPRPAQEKLADTLTKLPDATSDHELLARATLNQRELERAMDAVSGFEILGSKAASAAPALAGLMHDPASSGEVQRRAAEALGRLGLAGMPPLLEALTNPSPRLRLYAIRASYRLKELGTNAAPLIPPLILCAQEAYADIAAAAVQTLGQFEIERDLIVPALTNAFRGPNREARFWAVRAFILGLPGEAPRAAPALETLLNDPDYRIREDASNILARVRREAAGHEPRQGERE